MPIYIIPIKAMYKFTPDVLEGMFEFLVEDLRMLCTKGLVLKDGNPLWLVPLGVKGDWPFLVSWQAMAMLLLFLHRSRLNKLTRVALESKATAGGLTRTFRNGPKAAASKTAGVGICHLCRAGQPGLDFEDMLPA